MAIKKTAGKTAPKRHPPPMRGGQLRNVDLLVTTIVLVVVIAASFWGGSVWLDGRITDAFAESSVETTAPRYDAGHREIHTRLDGIDETLKEIRAELDDNHRTSIFLARLALRDNSAELLHFVALLGKPDEVDALIAKGANINAVTSSGCTPLDFAIRMGNPTADRLRAAGAKRGENCSNPFAFDG